MKTKQTVNALIFSVVLFLIVHVFQSLEAAGNTPLEQLAEGLSRHDVELEEWTMHTKKQLTLSEKDFFAKLKHFKKQHRQYEWTLTREDDDTVKATGVFQDKKIISIPKYIWYPPTKTRDLFRIYCMSKKARDHGKTGMLHISSLNGMHST